MVRDFTLALFERRGSLRVLQDFLFDRLADQRFVFGASISDFLAADVPTLLSSFRDEGRQFELIILDPPTFSLGNRGRRWKVEDQIEDLLRSALEVAAPKASILVSTNCTKLTSDILERTVRFVLKTQRIGAEITREAPLPDFPSGEGAQTLWAQLK